MRMNDRQRQSLIVAAIAAVLFALAWLWWPKNEARGRLTVATVGVPIVMHTSGGRLEVATITGKEAFKFDAPPKTLLGIDLGKTVSHVQADVVYRYHIEMAKEWPIRLQGTTAVVEAGEIMPTLPVAFDTATLEKQTKSGWARFDKHQNMDELASRITPELERRSHGYT